MECVGVVTHSALGVGDLDERAVVTGGVEREVEAGGGPRQQAGARRGEHPARGADPEDGAPAVREGADRLIIPGLGVKGHVATAQDRIGRRRDLDGGRHVDPVGIKKTAHRAAKESQRGPTPEVPGHERTVPLAYRGLQRASHRAKPPPIGRLVPDPALRARRHRDSKVAARSPSILGARP